MTENFGEGSNGPLLVTANTADKDQLTRLYQDLSTTEGVAAVAEPKVSKDGSAAMINVIPEGSPSSAATSDLVDEVRASVIPRSGVDAHVGGSTAQLLDLADLIGRRLPLIIAVVVGLSMLLLLIAFRSVVAPVQAALVNLLSVGAAYGIVTALFQEGHGASVIGLDGAIPVVSYVPMMLFAILFGLAMDYQVFLLSRVREEVDLGRSPRQAVIAGLAGTGKVIASAAAIMVAVFASFILNGDPTIKEFGVGLASAIFIAGAMVCVLLPAVMLLTGRHHVVGPAAAGAPPAAPAARLTHPRPREEKQMSTLYPRRWQALVVLALSLLVITVGNTILNVGLPTIREELDASARASCSGSSTATCSSSPACCSPPAASATASGGAGRC